MPVAALGNEVVQLAGGEGDGVKHADVRLDLPVEERALLGTSPHGQGDRRQCPSAGVDLDAVEVVGQDQVGDLGWGVALFLVDRVQQVEGVGQHVAGSAGRINDLELRRSGDLEEVGLLVDRGDVVPHLVNEV
ncbi:hypothetical protein SDC9_106747 [bioreactor metagenome]|uniref:Uncharacterized protein n=1 Tax=bioreactor metagenome TaxID=1076179 RepID=A0A645B5K9_9ZZZZ